MKYVTLIIFIFSITIPTKDVYALNMCQKLLGFLNDKLGRVKEFDKPDIFLKDSALLVVHAYSNHIGKISDTAIDNINKEIDFKRQQGNTIVNFMWSQNKEPETSWIGNKDYSDIRITSELGEHKIGMQTDRLTIIGKTFGACHLRATVASIKSFLEHSSQATLDIHYPMNSVVLENGHSLLKKFGSTHNRGEFLEYLMEEMQVKDNKWTFGLKYIDEINLKKKKVSLNLFLDDQPFFHLSPKNSRRNINIYFRSD